MLRFFRLFWYLLNHPQVGKHKKIIFVAFPIAYLISPDLMPFILDDLIVLYLGFKGFIKYAQKDVGRRGHTKHQNYGNGEVIDVEARVIKDD